MIVSENTIKKIIMEEATSLLQEYNPKYWQYAGRRNNTGQGLEKTQKEIEADAKKAEEKRLESNFSQLDPETQERLKRLKMNEFKPDIPVYEPWLPYFLAGAIGGLHLGGYGSYTKNIEARYDIRPEAVNFCKALIEKTNIERPMGKDELVFSSRDEYNKFKADRQAKAMHQVYVMAQNAKMPQYLDEAKDLLNRFVHSCVGYKEVDPSEWVNNGQEENASEEDSPYRKYGIDETNFLSCYQWYATAPGQKLRLLASEVFVNGNKKASSELGEAPTILKTLSPIFNDFLRWEKGGISALCWEARKKPKKDDGLENGEVDERSQAMSVVESAINDMIEIGQQYPQRDTEELEYQAYKAAIDKYASDFEARTGIDAKLLKRAYQAKQLGSHNPLYINNIVKQYVEKMQMNDLQDRFSQSGGRVDAANESMKRKGQMIMENFNRLVDYER